MKGNPESDIPEYTWHACDFEANKKIEGHVIVDCVFSWYPQSFDTRRNIILY